MDVQFWVNMDWLGLVLAHIITPFFPFAFPIRMAVTAGLAIKYNWLLVILVADVASSASLVGQYFIYRRLGAAAWLGKIERSPWTKWLLTKLSRRMFILLIALNATPLPDTVLPLMASAQRYSPWRFAMAMLLGRLLHIIPLALGGVGLKWWWQQLH